MKIKIYEIMKQISQRIYSYMLTFTEILIMSLCNFKIVRYQFKQPKCLCISLPLNQIFYSKGIQIKLNPK